MQVPILKIKFEKLHHDDNQLLEIIPFSMFCAILIYDAVHSYSECFAQESLKKIVFFQI